MHPGLIRQTRSSNKKWRRFSWTLGQRGLCFTLFRHFHYRRRGSSYSTRATHSLVARLSGFVPLSEAYVCRTIDIFQPSIDVLGPPESFDNVKEDRRPYSKRCKTQTVFDRAAVRFLHRFHSEDDEISKLSPSGATAAQQQARWLSLGQIRPGDSSLPFTNVKTTIKSLQNPDSSGSFDVPE